MNHRTKRRESLAQVISILLCSLAVACSPAKPPAETELACEPDTYRCNEVHVERCETDGSVWTYVETCDSGLCDEGMCLGTELDCGEGASALGENCLPHADYSGIQEAAIHPMAGVLYVPRRLTVYATKGHDSQVLAAAIAANGATVLAYKETLGRYRIALAEDATISDLLALKTGLTGRVDVDFATEVFLSEPSTTPDDDWPKEGWTGFGDWDEDNPGGANWYLEMIKAPAAWSLTGGENQPRIKVGVIDFGPLEHPDIEAVDLSPLPDGAAIPNDHIPLSSACGTDAVRKKLEELWSPGETPNGHGVMVAGVVAAKGNNGEYLTGVLWNADLYYCEFNGDPVRLDECITRMVAAGVKVINLSAGGGFRTNCGPPKYKCPFLNACQDESGTCYYGDPVDVASCTCDLDCPDNTVGLDDPTQRRGAELYRASIVAEMKRTFDGLENDPNTQGKEWVFVQSAGNDGLDASFGHPTIGLPLPWQDRVLTVAAHQQNGELSAFSNFGALDIAAPGGNGLNVDSAENLLMPCGAWDPHCTDGLRVANGTSFSAPLVTGVVALAWAVYPELPAKDIVLLVRAGAEQSGEFTWSPNGLAYPQLDALKAVEEVRLRCEIDGGTIDATTGICTGATLPVKPAGETCADRCGLFDNDASCQCNAGCFDIGDCCSDVCTACAVEFTAPCAECVSSCIGKSCGDNGCGGQCGLCSEGATCELGQCVQGTCQPDCTGKVCGDDGCGELCGPCAEDEYCDAGECIWGECTANCTGKECGDDGCGELCGECDTDQSCQAGQCIDDGCVPQCAGKECGSDECGSQCGTCQNDQSCQSGQCVNGPCVPQCAGKECGDDGCEDDCGECDNDESCQSGQCVAGPCIPNCAGKECGDDGCSGECGECPVVGNSMCLSGKCGYAQTLDGSSLSCLGGWCWLSPRPFDYGISDPWVSSNGNLFALGNGTCQKLLLEYDGNGWDITPLTWENGSKLFGDSNDLSGWGTDTLVMIADDGSAPGYPARINDQTVELLGPSDPSSSFYDGWTGKSILAVGSNTFIIASTSIESISAIRRYDNGTWSEDPLPLALDCRSILGTGPNEMYAFCTLDDCGLDTCGVTNSSEMRILKYSNGVWAVLPFDFSNISAFYGANHSGSLLLDGTLAVSDGNQWNFLSSGVWSTVPNPDIDGYPIPVPLSRVVGASKNDFFATLHWTGATHELWRYSGGTYTFTASPFTSSAVALSEETIVGYHSHVDYENYIWTDDELELLTDQGFAKTGSSFQKDTVDIAFGPNGFLYILAGYDDILRYGEGQLHWENWATLKDESATGFECQASSGRSIHVDPNGVVYIGTRFGSIATCVDGECSWEQVIKTASGGCPNDSGSGYSNSIVEIFATGPSEIYAQSPGTTGGGDLYYNNGNGWVPISLPYGATDIFGFWGGPIYVSGRSAALSGNDSWARVDGTQITSMPFPPGIEAWGEPNIYGIWGPNPNEIYLAINGDLFTYSGGVWVEIETPVDSVDRIGGISSSDFVVAGDGLNHFNGSSWQESGCIIPSDSLDRVIGHPSGGYAALGNEVLMIRPPTP